MKNEKLLMGFTGSWREEPTKLSLIFNNFEFFSQQPLLEASQQDLFTAIAILHWYELAITPTVANRKMKRITMEVAFFIAEQEAKIQQKI